VEAGAGFTGTPLDTLDAIQGARWSILHGYLWWWSCAKILNIVVGCFALSGGISARNEQYRMRLIES
jgi:hypothetical protein